MNKKEGNHVLFVDDEKYILNSLAKLFKSENNIKVHTASSCDEAIELISAISFDVVVTDYKMPEKDGLFLLNHIKENYRDIVTIMLTGYADTEIVIDALNRNLVYRFMTKPFEIKELIQVVNDAIAFSRKRDRTKIESSVKDDEILFNKIFSNFDSKKIITGVLSNSDEYLWLQNITKQFFSERDRNILTRKILYIARKITEADAGAVFISGKNESGDIYFRNEYSHSYTSDKPIIKKNFLLKEEEIIDELKTAERELSGNEKIRSIITEDYKALAAMLIPMKNTNNENTGFIFLLKNRENVKADEASFPDNLNKIMEEIAGLSSIAVENLNRCYMGEDLLEDFIKITASIIESRTHIQAGHSYRTAFFCRDIAAAINKDKEVYNNIFISEDEIKILEYSALLQNFGRFYSEKIKDKTEVLLYSYNFIKKLTWPDHLRVMPDIFLKYRERIDGSGYPARLKGEAIPLLSRILGFSEEFDSLTSGSSDGKSYPLAPDEALDKMSAPDEKNNSPFDPDIVKLFRDKKLYEKYI